MSKILITGATGHLGKGTIEFLLKSGMAANEISALVRDAGKSADLEKRGLNINVGNYNDYASLLKAFTGVEKLLFVSSSDVPNRIAQHQNVVQAAVEAGVKHIIYTGALNNTPIEKSAIAFVTEAHTKTEEWLAASGLPYTFMKNNLYLDLIPQFIGENVLETGKIFLPGGNGKTAFTLRSEMAEAAAIILASEGHEGKSYNITNREAYTYQNVADALTEITGTKINYVSPSGEEFMAALKNAGLPEEMIGGFLAFALAQAQDEFNITSYDLEQLLGRKPTTLREYLTSVYGSK